MASDCTNGGRLWSYRITIGKIWHSWYLAKTNVL